MAEGAPASPTFVTARRRLPRPVGAAPPTERGSDGEDVAVVMSTVWDTPKDAQEFSSALERWVSRGSSPGLVLDADGTTVHAGFGSAEPLMGAVSSILRSL